MRKLLIILLIGLSFAIASLVFYFYFPQIWGSVIYPLKYEELISYYAKKQGLSPSFVSAVIFVESHFNEHAISPMGARGLMQIMPQTASRIAKTMGDTDFSTEKLFEPERNIRYGTYYLRELIDRHQNDVDKALMAYNGGEMAMIGYEKRATLPRETESFVKKVKNIQDMYDRIYGSKWQKETQDLEQLKTQMEIEKRLTKGEKLRQGSNTKHRIKVFGPIILLWGWL